MTVDDIADRVGLDSVVAAFERHADAAPYRVAVRGPAGDATYAEVERRANVIAAALLARRGTGPEPIPLLVCSPADMLAAQLGVLKAGKFYVAVNPLHPEPRVRRMLDEVGAPLLVCDPRGAAMAGGAPVLPVHEVVVGVGDPGRPELDVDEDALAYVLYTSGSTGRPRGIAQSRRDMRHNIVRHAPLGIGPADCLTLVSADGFVNAVSNVWVALLNGAALAPYSFKDSGVDGVLGWLAGSGVTVSYGFPTFLRQFAAMTPGGETYAGLRLAYLGGETVLRTDLASARRLFPAAALATGLNSTETGLTCLHVIAPGAPIADPVPVGRAVTDVDIVLVGDDDEIEVRSAYVRPRLWTADGLRDQTTEVTPGTWAYRTGDRGRVDPDGSFVHLGRVDGMVKTRGFRVELAEVEAVIATLDGVVEVAVVGVGKPAELVAHVVASDRGLDDQTVRAAVCRALPAAMIPSVVVFTAALPRTANGKVDRRALAAATPSYRVGEPSPMNAPDDVVSRITAIWQAVLRVDGITADDDFFALGGTSITALKTISRVRAEFGVQVPLAVLFETPTIDALATAVRAMLPLPAEVAAEDVTIRFAEAADMDAVCTIVNYYIEKTTYSFRAEPQKTEEWIVDWAQLHARYPWLVAKVHDSVVGMAYAGPWKGRPAYDWAAEVTVYVAKEARRRGIGRKLYSRLLDVLDLQGYRTQLAVISLPNGPSVTFHESFGFRHAGTLAGVGYKHGRWLDVGLYQRRAGEAEAAPGRILPVAAAAVSG